MDQEAPRVSVVMIAMNEEGSVAQIIRCIRASCPQAEIVLVDSSTDRTAAIAEALGARVIRQFPPIGYGPAMDLALRSARGEVVITLDCDGTYPADQIASFAKYILEDGFDLVDGSRLQKKSAAMPWANYLANYAFAWVATVLFRHRVTDLHSGMRAYRKSMLDSLDFHPKGAALPVELLLRPLKHKFRVKQVFIPYSERIGNTTLQRWDSFVWTFKRIFRVWAT